MSGLPALVCVAEAVACATLTDTICGTLTLPCTALAADLTEYLGINGYVRGSVASGYHFFTGCAPNAVVTIYTGFTQAECELLRIRYADLLASDSTTPYPAPLLCASNNCNSPAAAVTGAGVCTASSGVARVSPALAVASATVLAVFAAV